MGKFHISTQILQETVLFSGKIYTAGHIFIRPLFETIATNFKSVMIVIMFGVGEEEEEERVAMRRNVESPRNEVTAPTNHGNGNVS